MKKLLPLIFAITMVLALAVPAMAVTPSGFISGTVATIDKKGYDGFSGKEITANNSTTTFNGFSLVADNKTLNTWYINVTSDINGTLDVAYKVGNAYYIVTFDIDGPGKYRIADSKGNAGANMAKVGAFVEAEIVPPHEHLFVTDVAVTFTDPSRITLPNDCYFWSGTLTIVLTLSDGTEWGKTWNNMGKIETYPFQGAWAINGWWFPSDDIAFGLDIDICKVVTVYYTTEYTYAEDAIEVALSNVYFENSDFICGY
jgi:hypothetical protein